MPGDNNNKVYFGNSGAESVEAAFKLARWYTKRELNIAFFGAFHGRTMGALSLTASKVIQKKHYNPFIPGITHIPYAYCYRCPYNLSYPECRIECVRWVEEALFRTTMPPEEVAAIFVEPIQGEGGYIVPPPEFHKELQKVAKKYGILYVADEVQSGMGRTGRMFAMEHFGVVPDIMALAKGIASGMPLGAMVAKAEIMVWEAGSHASTFGGNPVSCGFLVDKKKDLPMERFDMVFMRADLSGFTKMSEEMAAEDVMAFLNEVFAVFSKVIESYKGMIYQVIGDEMVNVFGFLVFHGGFEVPERVESNLVDTWVMEFPGDPFPLTREDTSLVADTAWKDLI